MAFSLLISNVRVMGAASTDMLIELGVIKQIGKGLPAPAGIAKEDGHGDILLPGFIEAHTHLDKSLWGLSWYTNEVGPKLLDKIDNERLNKRRLGMDPYQQSARQTVQSSVMGSTHIRSHVDVDTDHGMWGIEGVMKMRANFKEIMDVEIVAFPQSGLLRRPGTLELMDQAMKLGSEVVGGLDPCAIDRDPKGHLDAVFALSQKYAKPLDIHLHEPGEMGAFSMDLICERTRALGMKGKVTVSHAFCLGSPDRDLIDPLIAQLAELDIAIMTTGPASRPAPPVKKLIDAGIRVCSGSDGIRDTWGPYGNADMLERAMFVGLRNNFRRDDELRMALDVCTTQGARVMDITNYGTEIGCNADLILIPGETIAEAIVTRSPKRRVIKAGKIVARDGISIAKAP
jgi:cytosine/creatinine deaminase